MTAFTGRPVRVLAGDMVAELLPMPEAIKALARGFVQPLPRAPQRLLCTVGNGQLIVMPVTGATAAGAKLLTVSPDNPGRGSPLIQGVFVLFAGESLEPRLVIDGAALTTLRTSAVSGLATKLLARKDANRLVIFGVGVQARAHLEAMRAVRPISRIAIVHPDVERARTFAEDAGIEATATGPEAIADADIVCTCTTSREPVFDGSLLPSGAHVNAIGSYRPDTREIDDNVLRRGTVFVEDRDAVLAEAGDIIIPIASGAIRADDVRGDLQDVVAGRIGRSDQAEITVFKSVGVAFEDLLIAQAIAERWPAE